MSKIKTELLTLKEADAWSLVLFSLYKLINIPEYSSLSELAYLLDKDSMLKLCEYFGGQTIKIPTIDELEMLVKALLLYQYTAVDGLAYDDALKLVNTNKTKALKTFYTQICDIMSQYSFSSRS